MTQLDLQNKIEKAARVVGKTWPLYSFVTANPLSGFETLPFLEAVSEAGDLLDANLLPKPTMFRQAWEGKKIGEAQIKAHLLAAGLKKSPDHYLSELEAHSTVECVNENHELDRLTVKWLALFLDEGMAPWPMPFKEMGFYTAWRKLIVFDSDIKKKIKGKIPTSPIEAICQIVESFDDKQQEEIFKRHLAALPGWVGYIKYRVENGSLWNKEYPVNLLEFLAVRLWMADCINVPLMPKLPEKQDTSFLTLQYIWLEAWEQTWQEDFMFRIKKSTAGTRQNNSAKPNAQLVFCLDTRSELLRRSLEMQGNYETFGAAGAFGLPMDYRNPENGLINKSSPAMVPSQYLVHELPGYQQEENVRDYQQQRKRIGAYKYFLKRLKNILPSAFGFVEGAGLYYGVFMLMRLFKPNLAQRLDLKHHHGYEHIYDPQLSRTEENCSKKDILWEEKAILVKNVFDSCGWRDFASLVVFTGHASRSTNNPFASGLDCGACAGNPGKRNARMLAELANSNEVRRILKEKYKICIPDDTIFMAAEHITSCDEVQLFDHKVPQSHQIILQRLKTDLLAVKDIMTKERLNEASHAAAVAEIKSNSWSESRPEWGLSGHAGYIIGPRSLSLNGCFPDCFMSSYDWKIDKDGSILKSIMQGPMVVVQWISNHYYFSTVDNAVLGGGSKITHNISGKYGVVQGNGSDLKRGLPLQSLMVTDTQIFHNPIRLTTLIQAPKHTINEIILRDKKLECLLNNGWIHLLIMDPENNNVITKYTKATNMSFS